MKKVEKHSIQPARGWILVRQLAEQTVTKGGIEIPDTATEKPQEGTVLAVHADSVYKVGDTVLFARYAGAPIKLNDEMLLLLKEKEEYLGDIYGKV
jgi:chaperonin GroES